MAQELKEWFNPAFFDGLAGHLAGASPGFDRAGFVAAASRDLEPLGLMQRMTRTVEAARRYLPSDVRAAVSVLKQVAPQYQGQFAGMFMPEFVATYGLEDRDHSLAALAYFTRFFSAEFAVRHFLAADLDHTLAVMRGWAEDPDEQVRRLASEGSRPRLPWSFNLKPLIADPAPVRPILDRLNRDPAATVRKSVANHLNDIAKDHPQRMLDWISAWDLADPHSAWIAKHAARTLIKRGEPRAFALFGFEADPALTVEAFAVTPATVAIGGEVEIQATLVPAADRDQKLAVDYVVHFVKKSGRTSPKVFKLKELVLTPQKPVRIGRRHSFLDRSIRSHNPGPHRFVLLINGREAASTEVRLDRV